MAKLVPLTGQKLTLALPVTLDDTTINVSGKFKDTITGNGVVGPQMICLSPWLPNAEYCYIDITEEPVEIDPEKGTFQYALTTRGIGSGNRTAPPTSYEDALKRTHKFGEAVIIPISVEYFSQLEDATVNRFMQTLCFDAGTEVTVGEGRAYFKVPSKFDQDELTIANATVITAGVTGDTTIQVHNETTGEDMLSTPITIATTTTTGSGVVDAAQKIVSTGDMLSVDIDSTSTTKAKGLIVNIEFTQ